MELNKLLSTLDSSKMKVKEIAEAIETLKTKNGDLALFLINNSDLKITEYDVASYLMSTATKLIENRLPLNLVKNVYEQYSVIYAISVLARVSAKSETNKLNKMFVDIISNSAKFNIYAKVVKNVKLVSSADSITNELFWLIPLFSNSKVLTTIDYTKFITEMKEVALKKPEYILGYEYYVTLNVTNMDKTAYKQYLSDGVAN